MSEEGGTAEMTTRGVPEDAMSSTISPAVA
jgi:hypothetical protein